MQPPYGPYGQQPPYAQPYASQSPHAAQNPYAPPGPAMYRQNVFVPQGATAAPLVGPTLRKLKLAAGVGQLVTMFAGIGFLVAAIMNEGDGETFGLGAMAMFGLWYLLVMAYSIVNVIWLYKFWSWIPPAQRYTSMWKKYISPGTAAGFMFIPYFNIYWMFVVNLGIADILERMRVEYPCSKGPAKTLALLAIVLPLVFFPAAPFLQYLFAKHVEEMAAEMAARMPGAMSPQAAYA